MSKFTDSKGWYPGMEYGHPLTPGGANRLFFRDLDASTVVPSVGNVVYSTRVVDPSGNPVPALYGAVPLGFTSPLGTGNPADAGVAIGVSIEVTRVAKDNSYATVHVVPAP